MCGIFGYVGKNDPLELCLNGLERLEYRGYDSTGIAGVSNNTLIAIKQTGKVAQLKKRISEQPLSLEIAIGHIRWATHGGVTDQNAHPHTDSANHFALVHNGIIDNYIPLREQLRAQGALFLSETDTEVIAQLIASLYKGDLLRAVQEALLLIKGTFAIALIHKDHPDQIIAAASEIPLAIAWDDLGTEAILSSDPNSFHRSDLQVLFLSKGQIVRMSSGSVELFDRTLQSLPKASTRLEGGHQVQTKGKYPHFMLKEIYEQPTTIYKAFSGRFLEETGQPCLEHLDPEFFRPFQRLWILGCGTSAHAGTVGAMLSEELAHFPAQCDISSEARFRSLQMNSSTLVLAISQSGETADTITAVREVKQRGCTVIAICNSPHSTLTREADKTLYLNAGPEISVCSTKAFTSQLTVLLLIILSLARFHGLEKQRAIALYDALKEIPQQIEEILIQFPLFQKLGRKYSAHRDFFFMGRRYMFPTCLEAALKLKEISYANANGYPAGELKHGPLALLDANFPVIAFCGNEQTKEKIISNLMEVKARGAPLLALLPRSWQGAASIPDDIIWLPDVADELSPLLSVVAGQLFAYCVAHEKGCDIDQPRNLAKSVTVE